MCLNLCQINPIMAELVEKAENKNIVRNIIRNRLTQVSRERKCSIEDVRKELLAFLGVTSHQYKRWENNTTQPDLAYAILVADFFQENVNAIFFMKN
jgi:DNA-binding XRE family transcriptional regulator